MQTFTFHPSVTDLSNNTNGLVCDARSKEEAFDKAMSHFEKDFTNFNCWMDVSVSETGFYATFNI